MKEYTLAIMLLVQLSETVLELSDAALLSKATTVFLAIVDVLCKCSDFPSALAWSLLPVVER